MNIVLNSSLILLIAISSYGQSESKHNLYFNRLAEQWDEAIPLGNATLGALIWQKGSQLRFSLDRADLWDMRPMKGLHRKEFSYKWVQEQVKKNNYKIVQKYFDEPYDREPGPSKIPGGALEFSTESWGEVTAAKLSLQDALATVRWSGGTTLETFVHATDPVGWFRFTNVPSLDPKVIAPRYQGAVKVSGDPVGGDDLSRLGYEQGAVKQEGQSITYIQKGWGGFSYEISVRWKQVNASTIEGVWSISSKNDNSTNKKSASSITNELIQKSTYTSAYSEHKDWWRNFWNKSSISIPDSLLEKQWYLEQYKFGSTSRRGAPPISLQAIWTADNGRLPPWKGDYHHDLNTQLSYWPCYSGNHLEEGLAYLDHLDENKANYKRYTKLYFGKDGLAVPGVTTLDGTEMGGWIQYSLSPTVSAWLSQHYYLHWRYSMDYDFLKKRAYPWIKDVAVFLEKITIKDEQGLRKLPISSSPEINDNDLSAWFFQNTNYDLALMKFNFSVAAELANELGLKTEAQHWQKILTEFDNYSFSKNDALQFAPQLPYNQSHRHFSNAMAIHPLGLIRWEDGEKSQAIIKNTIHVMDSIGPDYWTGYSYSWMANMKARAKDGEGAAEDLNIFAKAFCSGNSFHLNGDQTKSGYSKYQYRPFTLEGNFAFAAGLQEMLLQSYAGFIEVMPAVPLAWKDISFQQLRAEGAFLVDAKKEDRQIVELTIVSEKGGNTRLKLPFPNWLVHESKGVVINDIEDGFLTLTCEENSKIVLRNRVK